MSEDNACSNASQEAEKKEKLAALFAKAIDSEDHDSRLKAISWLTLAREILDDSNLTRLEKTQRIYQIVDTRAVLGMIGTKLTGILENLPLAMKMALPVTLIAVPFVGGSGAGIAAFGSAIGVPVLLIVFLGSAGITSILETFIGKSEARDYMSVVLAMIAQDEVLRRTRHYLRSAMITEPVKPHRFDVSKDAKALQDDLLKMDPYDFERHVMSFFQQAGMLAWVTKQTNDGGVDGFVRHANGLILVQCKRHGRTNFIGRPAIQQLKGVIEENEAWRGYIVTTSKFTQNAIDSAASSDQVILIDIDILVRWHQQGFALEGNEEMQPFEYKPVSFLDEIKKSLSKDKAKKIEEYERAYAKGFLSDEHFEKLVEEIIL